MLLHFCAQLLTLTTAPHPTLTLTPTLQFWAQLSPFKSTLALNVVEEGMDERLAPLLGIGQRNGSVGENIGDHGATDTDTTRRCVATAPPPLIALDRAHAECGIWVWCPRLCCRSSP